VPTDQRPNLDYESGPVGCSYSRLGPPSPAVPAGRAPDAPDPEQFRHEAGEELAPALQSRRHRHRR
jgi:hypothetical protein